ncbi:hypothetical protein M9H77_25160 [Catharanthus roseus]|uniref:Uncharacterized protein n=1 Tax=Catharanthus roseus TaxID=4058 RepID=A0ACC0A643_CATRO|nr:hypothetical protein M9H77_25160 [Catharanthus roseus]
MAISVVGAILNQLSLLLHQEYTHLRGLRQGLQFINDELCSMRAFLRDVEAQSEQNNELLQEWVKQVREAAYDIEDVIDECMLFFAPFHVSNIYNPTKTLNTRHRISNKIKEIKDRVENIFARHQRYKLDYGFYERESNSIGTDENIVRHIRQRALLLEEAELVGIDVPKKELLGHILDRDNLHLKVVSIVGMGGSGKTTLVRRVYEDANVKRLFQCHVWVTISQTFEIKVILKDLIQQLHTENMEHVPLEVESMDVDGLKVFINHFLQGKKYIIVFDDIWRTDAWEDLIYALPDCDFGSRVMLTTRIDDVASASCQQHHGYLYRMKSLDDDMSWTLFCNKSFQDKYCPPHLESISRKILDKCEGLPLAIVSIGGLLLLKINNDRLEEWEKVYRTLSNEFECHGKLDRVKRILLLSYNDLPYYLKGCLMYISIFPEDSKISSELLIRRWIAEGLVQEREGLSCLETAEEYLNELVCRSLVQVLDRDIHGLPQEYHIHDLVREITLSKAKEHGIITIFKGRDTKGLENARRLIVHDFKNDPKKELVHSKHLRSLTIFRYVDDHKYTSSLLKFFCGKSKLIKVIDFVDSMLENIPKEVFKLYHLRYLNLQGSKVKFIPKNIKNLQNLEFLNLLNTQVIELPSEILKLRKLRELYVCHYGDYSNDYAVSGFKAPNEIGRLFSLQNLFFIEAKDGEILKEIGKLNQLRGLGITKLRKEDGKQLCFSLEKLKNLRKLHIVTINEDEILDLHHPISTIPMFLQHLLLDGHLEKIPSWVPSLQGLTQLNLFKSGLKKEEMATLEMLPNLLQLVLVQAYEEEEMWFQTGGFRKLKLLFLVQLKRLRKVMIEEGAMPDLKEVQMVACKSMEEVPKGIENLRGLQQVRLYEMSMDLIGDLENGKQGGICENYQRIAHVPEVFIGNFVDGKWDGHYL